MALDAAYFDSIYIEVVKKKYYEAAKVQKVFRDIRRQAEADAALERKKAEDEMKREIADGELSSTKKAMLPVIAAFGGVLVPALIFTLINHKCINKNSCSHTNISLEELSKVSLFKKAD